MLSFIRSREAGIIKPAELKHAQNEDVISSYINSQNTFSNVHFGAVNTLRVEQEKNRYLMSGGADSSIHLWDLLQEKDDKDKNLQYKPIASIGQKKGHDFGISCVLWWPHDSGLFVSTSFDGYTKVWDTNTFQEAYKFNIALRIYSADISLDGLVCIAADHSHIRLLDLRTTSSSQVLKGHNGSVISVQWSPIDSRIMASAGSDGSVRLWDIRRSDSCFQILDHTFTKYTPLGNLDPKRRGVDTRLNAPRAHRAAANGLCWVTSSLLISYGNDEKLMLWDLTNETNLLVNYGFFLRNKFPQTLNPCLMYYEGFGPHRVLVSSDSGEIFMFQVEDGKLSARLSRGYSAARSLCLTGRGSGYQDYFSGTLDGHIILWSPFYEHKDVFEKPKESLGRKSPTVLDIIHSELNRSNISIA